MTLLSKARSMRAALLAPLVHEPECEVAGDCSDNLAESFVAAVSDAYHERIAIVMEAGDIGETEAEATAALEVGRAFVRQFLRPISGPKQ